MSHKHFLQSEIWKEFKQRQGLKTIRYNDYWFQIKSTPFGNIGYMPRVDLNQINFSELFNLGKENNCTFITIDPWNLESEEIKTNDVVRVNLKKTEPIHLKHNIVINLDKTEEELMSNIKKKNRYYIRKGIEEGVKVRFGKDEASFETFLQIYEETKSRHNYAGRDRTYITELRKVLEEFEKKDGKEYYNIAIASLNGRDLVAWFLFVYENHAYYPYGGSRLNDSSVNVTYVLPWQVMLWAKGSGCKSLDLWGIEPGEVEGFSGFKRKFGGETIAYADSLDVVIKPFRYNLIKFGMGLRQKFEILKKLI